MEYKLCQKIMNKKNLFLLSVFIMTCFCLHAGQNIYNVNQNNSQPLRIIRDANIKENRYEFFIEDGFGNVVYSKREPKLNSGTIREFIASEESFSQIDQILISWEYKGDDGKLLNDGIYKLILKETNRREQSKVSSYEYTICLDTEIPFINPVISTDKVYRNSIGNLNVSMGFDSEKANFWKVILDNNYVLYESNLPENELRDFPTGIELPYEKYKHLNIGMHEIKVIGKDCAGNTAEKSLYFDVEEYPLKLDILPVTKEVVYYLDNTISDFQYIGTGVAGIAWKTNIMDASNQIHFSMEYKAVKDVTCPLFIWNGVSSLTNQKVPDGIYFAEILCNDLSGNSFSEVVPFKVTTEIAKDENYGKPPFVSGRYEENKFILNLINYPDKVASALLMVYKENQLLYEKEVDVLNDIIWDGTDNSNNFVLSTCEDYDFILKVINDCGDESCFSSTMQTTLVCDDISEIDKRIIIDSIYFDGNESEILTDSRFFFKNAKVVQKIISSLSEQISKNDDILVIAGNANYTTYPNEKLMKAEQQELIQLSTDRAEAIKKILVFYGFPESRVVIKANGGESFVALPNSKENWKNRRVDFYINSKGK